MKHCKPYCSGLVVSSFFEFEHEIDLKTIFARHESEYGKLTDWFPFPKNLKDYFQPEKKTKNPLRLVRIYFDTPTIERIIKEKLLCSDQRLHHNDPRERPFKLHILSKRPNQEEKQQN